MANTTINTTDLACITQQTDRAEQGDLTKPSEPIHLPYHPANELYSGGVSNFFQAMDLVEDQCNREMRRLGYDGDHGHLSRDAAGERTTQLATYRHMARQARRIYARWIAEEDDTPLARESAVLAMRTGAGTQHETPGYVYLLRIADALATGNYTRLAL